VKRERSTATKETSADSWGSVEYIRNIYICDESALVRAWNIHRGTRREGSAGKGRSHVIVMSLYSHYQNT